MADEFLDDALAAESRRLIAELRGLEKQVAADNAVTRDNLAQQKQEGRKADRRIAREEGVERRRRRSTTPSLEADLEAQRARDAERRLAAERQITRQSSAQVDNAVRANRLALPRAGDTSQGYFGGLTPAEVRARAEQRGLTTGAFGGGGQPPARPPTQRGDVDPEEYRRRLRDEAAGTRALGEEQQKVAAQGQRVAVSQRGISAATTEAGIAAELAANRYRRHGALTTEFIEAARRGEVEIRELGYQVTATIGKFAGWTAAAGAVYGAAAAVGELGRGALDSLNGVNQLSRIITGGALDTEKVQRDFRGLSEEFNLPIGDVAEAAYQMSKVFANSGNGADQLENTLKGTRAALFAVKVGELDAGQATQYLTAIIQGAKLSAADLVPVMDAVNQVTNRFGGNVGGLVQGVANATGAFTAAKGSVKDLVAFVETGIKVTGRSGSEIGTALRRTSEIIQRPERRASIIQLLGIDPRDSSITEVLERAAKLLETASPDLRSGILRAITTPELASGRILPILQNYDLYKRIRRETEADRSRGSAEKELQRTLRAPGEEIGRFRNELQRLGSTFAQIGALDPFVLMLKGINRSIDLANHLLQIFTVLPREVRTLGATFTAMAATVALLRRFNVGDVLPGQPQFLQRNPQKLNRAAALSGLRGFKTETAEELRRSGVTTLAASRNVDFMRSINATEEEIEAAQQTYNTQLARRRFLEQQQLAVQEEINAVQKGGLAAQTASYQAGSVRRDLAGAAPIATGGAGIPPAGGGGRAVVAQMARQERLMQVRLAQYGVSGAALGRALDAGDRAVIAARNSTVGLGGALQRRVSSLRALGPAIGGLDAALIGLFIGYEIFQAALDNQDREEAIISRLESQAGRVKNPQELARRAKAALEENVNTLTTLQDAFADTINAGADAFLTPLDAIIPGPTVRASTPHQDREAEVRRAQQEADAIQKARDAGAAPGFLQRELLARLRRRLAGARTERQQEELLQRAEQDLGVAREQIYGDLSARQRGNLRQRGLAAIQNLQKNLVTAVQGLDYQLDLLTSPDQLESFLGARTTRLQRGFTGRGQLNRGIAGAAVRARELAANASPEDAQRLLQLADQAEAAILDQAKTKLDRALDYARNPREAGRARREFLGTARRTQIGAYRRRIEELRDGIKAREDEMEAQVQALRPQGGPGSAGGAGARRAGDAREALKGLRAQQGEARGRITELRRSLREQRRAFNDIRREQDKAQYELRLTSFDARTERLQSTTADPVAQARILVQRMRARTAIVIGAFRRHLATQADLDRAIAQQNQALQQQAQAELQRYQLNQEVATSQYAIGATDQQLLQRQLADAQNYLAKVQSTPGVSPDEIAQAQIQVNQIKKQIADQTKQEAEDLLGALEELALARAGEDPIRQARIRLDFARRRLATANTPAERIRGRADVINNRRGLRDSRLQERLDERDFQYEMGRLTRDQYIGFLERFLRNNAFLRKTNREWYRRLRLQLRQLRQEGEGEREDFELNVGDIRLPTVYEVRRALGGGAGARRSATAASVTNHNAITLYVSRDADMGKVAQVLSDYTEGGVKEAARAAGVIG